MVHEAELELAATPIRDEKVILDSDRDQLFVVETGRLQKQVCRNSDNFLEVFMFQLTQVRQLEVANYNKVDSTKM
jgi:hypothetical protein